MIRKQEILADFYRLFYNEKRCAETARLLAETYVNHHGGRALRGRDEAVRSFEAFAANAPSFRIDIKRTAEDGPFVWVHSLVTGLPDGATAAVVDIWRFEGDEIAEHWDVGQRIPAAGDPAEYV